MYIYNTSSIALRLLGSMNNDNECCGFGTYCNVFYLDGLSSTHTSSNRLMLIYEKDNTVKTIFFQHIKKCFQ